MWLLIKFFFLSSMLNFQILLQKIRGNCSVKIILRPGSFLIQNLTSIFCGQGAPAVNCRKTSLNKPTGNKAIQPFVHFPISGYLLYVSLPLRCNAAEIDKACKPHLHHHCLFHFNSVKMNYEMFRESFLMPKGIFHKCLISFIHSDKKTQFRKQQKYMSKGFISLSLTNTSYSDCPSYVSPTEKIRSHYKAIPY